MLGQGMHQHGWNLRSGGHDIGAAEYVGLADRAIGGAVARTGDIAPGQSLALTERRVYMGLDEIALGKKSQRQKNGDKITPSLLL